MGEHNNIRYEEPWLLFLFNLNESTNFHAEYPINMAVISDNDSRDYVEIAN